MKWLFWIIGILVVLIVALYVLLFTPPGNALVKPYIEKEIQKATQLNSAKLNVFILGFGSFDIELELTPKNTIKAKGDHSLISQSLEASYNISLTNLEALSSLTQQPLKGTLNMDGSIKG
ncbi:MAG: hypothetical protein ACLFQJ_05835, partial [Campylobacterales bacterium]